MERPMSRAALGVDHVVRMRRNKGLAAAFTAGIDAALKNGADFIVNTDADNQYPGHQIAALLQPLLSGEADLAIGDRNIAEVSHMSWRKRQLQRLGSWVVRQVSNTSVPDTTSGFRAYTREAALRMTIVSEFSYTLESIIQAGKKRMAIAHVPIQTNSRTRRRASSTACSATSSARRRRSSASTRCTSRSRSFPISAAPSSRSVSALRTVRLDLFQRSTAGGGPQSSVPDPGRGLHDCRISGAPHRPAGGRDLCQSQTARGSPVSGALARTATARADAVDDDEPRDELRALASARQDRTRTGR